MCRSKENENAADAASDPAIKASVDAFSMDLILAATEAVEAELAGGWLKPPEPPGKKYCPHLVDFFNSQFFFNFSPNLEASFPMQNRVSLSQRQLTASG